MRLKENLKQQSSYQLKNTKHLDPGDTENATLLKTATGHCQNALEGEEASEKILMGWNYSSTGKVFALQAQEPEFDPPEATFLKVGYCGVCL